MSDFKVSKPKDMAEINRMLGDAWLNINVDEKTLFNPMETIPAVWIDTPELYFTWLMSRPEYFSFVCKEVFNIQLLPMQALILKEMWNRKFPLLIGARGLGKSFLLGLYALLRITFMRQRKVVIVGAAFRQSKVIFEYMETIWNNAPVLRSMCPNSSGPKHEQDMWRFFIGDSVASALPLGDGTKIRGQRANDIMNDEFASTPREIFENVVAGFGSVSASPIENVMVMASNMLAEEWGIEVEEDKDEAFHKSNQIILSGTAYYDFNHFAEYWKYWSAIVRTKGDPKKIQDIFNKKAGNKKLEETPVPSDFNWTDYSVIRIPYELIPLGFMDAGQVARSKATIHTGIYEMEYGAVFSSDSNGFYKRSLIETCVGTHVQPISLPSGEVNFGAMIRGNPAMKYVYGIDPASEVDNFTIVIMEVRPDHHRIVYVWSTTRKDHREKVKSQLIKETDFYSYCCRQIRDLMKKFPCSRIALDAQGGGIAVIEGLHDQDKIQAGELPIWPTVDLEKEKDTDGESGLHIVEMIQFASADWTSEANHGLRKDFEDKVTLFPHFDGLELSIAANKDALKGRLYDTLEDCMLDIEELKDELSTIIISETPSGREKWDTPEIKLPGNKKGRQRKDRYSALLMANMVARQLVRDVVFDIATTDGGFAGNVGIDGGVLYHGPAWFTEKIQGVY